MKPKVLVLGSEGFIGSHVWPLLEGRVVRFDRKLGEDIFDDNLGSFIEDADVVVDLIGETNVNKSFKNPRAVYETNILATSRVAYLCLREQKKLIYISSAAVHEFESSPYAYSKWLAERIVEPVGKHISLTILRPYNVYGPGMNENSGSVMFRFLNEDPITVYGSGEQVRDFIYVDDLARIIVAAIGPKWDDTIIDVGTGRGIQVGKLAELFSSHRGVSVKHEKERQEIRHSVCDNSDLRRLWNKPLISVEEGVAKLCSLR